MSEHIFQTDEFDGVFSVFVAPNIGISNVTGQREEIVRCRDCAHALVSKTSISCHGPIQSASIAMCAGKLVEPEGFCAWGERR